jgi:Zn-dependent protease
MLIIIALSAHEAAHIISAILLKIKFDRFKITLFGYNFNADLESIVLIKKILLFLSGPACNLLLYIIFKNTVYAEFADVNIFLAIINMIPLVPLDGGNICKTVLEIFLDIKTVCRYMIMTNTFFIICLLVIIHMYENYLFFLLIIMALKGILEENRCLIEKSIRKNYNIIKLKK